MDTYIREQITNLRHTLHACPEISGQEKQTKIINPWNRTLMLNKQLLKIVLGV